MMRLILIGLLAVASAFAQLGGASSGSAIRAITVTIDSGAALSTEANLGACTPVGLEVATQAVAGWTTANLTVLMSSDGTNFRAVYDEYGNAVTLTVPAAANSAPIRIRLSPGDFYGAWKAKVQSTANQSAARALRFVCR